MTFYLSYTCFIGVAAFVQSKEEMGHVAAALAASLLIIGGQICDAVICMFYTNVRRGPSIAQLNLAILALVCGVMFKVTRIISEAEKREGSPYEWAMIFLINTAMLCWTWTNDDLLVDRREKQQNQHILAAF